MYESAEVIIRLNEVEVQQALGIWLDEDDQQALRFIKEKIVEKTMRSVGRKITGPNPRVLAGPAMAARAV